jgi:site-specific DNA-methyltransferase (adenine-specific)
MQFTVKQGMNQDILKSYPDNHFDSIVTDPPYGIEFLGKDWDSNTGAIETWQECFRVLKPGGHLLAFSAARTYHHLATNIENTGFEIRDQLMWIYASGFPKAQDIGKAIQKRQGVEKSKPQKGTNAFTKSGMSFSEDTDNNEYDPKKDEVIPTSPEAQQWAGWKTALKPGHEPIVMARKPFKGSTIDNVLKHGTGALNIDATRIGDEVREIKDIVPIRETSQFAGKANNGKDGNGFNYKPLGDKTYVGRFPSNVMGEITDYQKYFYCPKVSRAERHCGFESVPDRVCGPGGDDYIAENENYLLRKNKGSLDHIPTDSDGMLDKGVLYQHTKGGSLDHIPTGKGGMYDNHGTGVMYNIGTDMKSKKSNLDHIPTGNNIGDGVYAPGTPGNKNNAVGKIQTGLTDKNGNVQTFTSDPATHNLGNNHPTVKPVALMKYLIQLVTPEGGKVLDPFTGSGSTGMAAVEADMCFTGCELDPNYVKIANKRIQAWYTRTQPDNNFKELFDASN